MLKKIKKKILKYDKDNNVVIEEGFSLFKGEVLKIHFIKSKDEKLRNLKTLYLDEARMSFMKQDEIYIVKKVSETIARKLFRSFNEVVAFFKSETGTYIISKIGKNVWSFKGIGKKLKFNDLEKEHKSKLSELLIEKLIKIYENKIGTKEFSLKDIYLNDNEVIFLPDFKLGANFKSFINNLKLLFKMGISNENDIFYALALSFNIFKKEFKKRDKDELKAIEKVKKEIIQS